MFVFDPGWCVGCVGRLSLQTSSRNQQRPVAIVHRAQFSTTNNDENIINSDDSGQFVRPNLAPLLAQLKRSRQPRSYRTKEKPKRFQEHRYTPKYWTIEQNGLYQVGSHFCSKTFVVSMSGTGMHIVLLSVAAVLNSFRFLAILTQLQG
eukprot:2209433-Amphidinium_carterae.1